MKNKNTVLLFFLLLIPGFFRGGKTTAQTADVIHVALEQTNADAFDEKAMIAELKQKGIPECNYNELIKSRKKLYIAAHNGVLKPRPYFAPSNPNTLRTSGGCPNAGFEDGTFTNWTGATGDCIAILPRLRGLQG